MVQVAYIHWKMRNFLTLNSDWLGQTDIQTLTIFSAPILTDITLSYTKGNIWIIISIKTNLITAIFFVLFFLTYLSHVVKIAWKSAIVSRFRSRRLIVRFIAIKSTSLMNFDGLCRFCFADFCNEVVIYRYYQKNRRLIAINLPFLIEIAINR